MWQTFVLLPTLLAVQVHSSPTLSGNCTVMTDLLACASSSYTQCQMGRQAGAPTTDPERPFCLCDHSEPVEVGYAAFHPCPTPGLFSTTKQYMFERLDWTFTLTCISVIFGIVSFILQVISMRRTFSSGFATVASSTTSLFKKKNLS